METTSLLLQCSSMVFVTNLSSASCPSPAHQTTHACNVAVVCCCYLVIVVVVIINVMYALNPLVPGHVLHVNVCPHFCQIPAPDLCYFETWSCVRITLLMHVFQGCQVSTNPKKHTQKLQNTDTVIV